MIIFWSKSAKVYSWYNRVSHLSLSLKFSFGKTLPNVCMRGKVAEPLMRWIIGHRRMPSGQQQQQPASRCGDDGGWRRRRGRPILPHSAASWCGPMPQANHHNLREWGKMVPSSRDLNVIPEVFALLVYTSFFTVFCTSKQFFGSFCANAMITNSTNWYLTSTRILHGEKKLVRLSVRLWCRQQNGRRLWTTDSERRTRLTTVDNTSSETTVCFVNNSCTWSNAKSNRRPY